MRETLQTQSSHPGRYSGGMKTQISTPLPPVAILTAELQSSGDGWYQLLPAGEFKARDGRPHDVARGCWYIDADIAAQFIAATAAVGQPVLCDYNHATLRDQDPERQVSAEQTAELAKAAGWLDNPAIEMQWRESGLYVRPRWTPAAQAGIDAEEWRYLSAVFPYDTETGHPLYLRMFAITNDPGLVGMEPLVALAAASLNDSLNPPTQQDEPVMNEMLKLLLIALGLIPADDTTEYTEEQLKELVAKAAESIGALKTAAEAAVQVQDVVETGTDPEAIVSEATTIVEDTAADLKEAEAIIAEAELHGIDLTVAVPRSEYNKLVRKLAEASLGNAALTAEQIIRKARAQGKVMQSEVPGLLALAKKGGVAALSSNLLHRTPIVALGARQTSTLPAPAKTNTVALSAEDRAVIKATGVSEAEFLANKIALMKG